jgi:hypothetical protein
MSEAKSKTHLAAGISELRCHLVTVSGQNDVFLRMISKLQTPSQAVQCHGMAMSAPPMAKCPRNGSIQRVGKPDFDTGQSLRSGKPRAIADRQSEISGRLVQINLNSFSTCCAQTIEKRGTRMILICGQFVIFRRLN